MDPKIPKLHDWQILQNVAPYLNLSDLIKSAVLSKEFNYSLRSYFRKHILPNNSSTNNQDQLNIAKKVFQRQIRIFKLDSNLQISHIPNLILKSLQVGLNYTLLETYQNQKLFVANESLASKNFQLKIFNQLPKKYNTKQVHLIGQFLYVAFQNKLIKISLNENNQTFFTQSEIISLQNDITGIKISQTHIFIVTTNSLHQNKLFAVSLKLFKSQQISYSIQKAPKNSLNFENLYVAANSAFYIQNFKVYQLDVQKISEPKILKSLKDKNIRRIINGAKHFFAIQKMIKITEQWNTQDVITWAKKEGYQDYVKIFKSQKVTGNILLNMDKKYMEDVLGIINVKVQQRLQVQLQENRVQKQENCTIWAWGRNDKSQLGTNPSNPVSNPFKVKLQEGYSILACYNNITLIHNKKIGKVAINSVNQNKAEWKVIYQKVHNIWSINSYKDLIILLSPVQKSYVSQQLSQVPVHLKKQKLRTAKNIIDKISWDQNINKQNFRVGYLDKFTGILQMSFEQLQRTPDVKDYRIQYFKRKGQVVWSKKDRIDIL